MRPITLLEPFRALFYAPFYLAEACGGFARQGVAVKVLTAGSTDAAAAMLLDGKADLAWSGPMRPLLLRSQDPGCTLRSFCAVVMRDPFLLLGAAPRPAFGLQDLVGLRLGLVAEVPTPAWCLKGDLDRARIDFDMVHTTKGPSMAENAAAIMAGQLDVAQMFEPFACEVEDAGGAVWHAQAARGLTAYSAFYATEAGIASRRSEIMAMIRAVAEALAFIRTAPATEVAAILAPRFADVPAKHLVRAIARYQALNLWEAGPVFPREAFDTLGAAMLAAGAINHIPPFEVCVDQEIVAEALA